MQSFAAYQQQGNWNHALSTLKVSATVEACVDLLFTTQCTSVSDSATPHVGGTLNLYGAPCPGETCEISLETDVVVDDFDLEFELLGFTVGKGKLRDLHMTGASGHVAVDAAGDGVLPAGSFVFTAHGRDVESGDSYRMINGSTHDVPFHIDWQARTISLSNVSLPFASGRGLLNLTGNFRPSLLENIGKLDSDRDGVPNTVDNCPLDANPDQVDRTAPTIVLGDTVPRVSCSRGAVALTLPTVSDSCSLSGGVQLRGAVVQSNGLTLPSPLPVDAGGQINLPPGSHVVRWKATDAAGNVTTSDQAIELLPCIAATNGLVMNDRARLENASGAPVDAFNYGAATFDLGVEASVGTITSIGSVSFEGQWFDQYRRYRHTLQPGDVDWKHRRASQHELASVAKHYGDVADDQPGSRFAGARSTARDRPW